MNKVFNINLGGYPFTIDDDAYEHLSNYLKTIHRHFQQSEGYEEITSDIETRMAELLVERLDKRPIVTQKDINTAINVMGTPEDFGAEAIADEHEDNYSNPKTAYTYKTGKRLFRDPHDKVVGGMCSGIAAYFGIEDPLWLRIGFLAFTMLGGSGVLIYLILWAVVPKTSTSADRLAMRGEKINVSNIAKIVEEEVENFSEKISEWGNELGSKKKVLTKEEEYEMPLRKGFLY